MPHVIVTDESVLNRLVNQAVSHALEEHLPRLVRKATRRPWLTKEDLKEMTGWSDRTIQHLRDTRQIPFAQHGRKILYPAEGIEQFLRNHHILPRTS